MELTFLSEGEEPEEMPRPPIGAQETETEYLDWVREMSDAELIKRWRDVETDPDLVLDWTDKGFRWTREELHEAIQVAEAVLHWDSEELAPYLEEDEAE